MRCASCGFENPEGVKFCHECGVPLKNRCPSCEVENPLQAKFCGECGTPLTATQTGKRGRGETAKREKAKGSKGKQPIQTLDSRLWTLDSSREAERRQLTVMFCDVVGSTALSAQLDPEELREVVRDYQKGCAAVIRRFEGHIAQYLGDGLLVYFGYPRAHEDDAQRAVRAGLRIIEAVGRLPAQQDLQVRLGIATGVAVVGDLIGEGAAQERGVVGETPNLAARLQALAGPNMLVIAEATHRQIGGLFDLADLGPQALAGFAEPQS